jgi:two-component system, sensor histidine kinase and response regulator
MRKTLQNLSLGKKITGIIIISTAVALILSSCAFLWLAWNSLLISVKTDAIGLAQAIGNNCTAALFFKDVKSADEIISAFESDSRILQATLYEKDGSTLASYHRHDFRDVRLTPPEQPKDAYFQNRSVAVFRNIEMDHERIGAIYICISMNSNYSLFAKLAFIMAGTIVGVLLLTYFVAVKLQVLASQPVLDLAKIVKSISSQKNYNIRAPKTAQDEVGDLIEGFNEMLDKIQEREEELHRHSEKLALRSTEISAINAQLNLAIDKAERASKAKSEFLAKMSHELRTPLNAVIGYTELLKEEIQESSYVSDLDKIHTAARHLLSLINDVLDISKIEAGKMEVHLESFNVRQLIEEVMSTMRESVAKNRNELIVRIMDDTGNMVSDPVKVRQILLNLIGNAGKFTHGGQVKLQTYRFINNGSPWLCFEVSDTGIGISSEDQKRLFQAFSQADSSTSRKYGGTGLGLAITQRLVQMLGGEIAVKSTPQMGSTFTFRLPAEFAGIQGIQDAPAALNSEKSAVVSA